MNIALIGYGKMGKEIEAVAIERKHNVTLIIDVHNANDFTVENLKKVDVAIEFTHAEVAYKNCLKCFEANIPVVSGTTGWPEKLIQLKEICLRENKGFFHTPNFSIGVNLFFKLNEWFAGIMNHFPEYDISMTEIHHTQKLDAPSGTAIRLADDLIGKIGRKKKWKLNDADNAETIQIKAIREGQVPGIHTVRYESPIDFIELTHSAKSRKGFALGAVIAAEFMQGKKGVYSMSDLLNF